MNTMDLITATEMLNNDLQSILSSAKESIDKCSMENDNGEAIKSKQELEVANLLYITTEQLSDAIRILNVIRANQTALFSITQDLDIEVKAHR